jgi:PAS domain S-box-containing protein
MWFGTKDGLNRYDGYENKVYKKRLSDTSSLTDNYISSLYLDSYKRLWVGTQNGLCLFNYDKDNFTRFIPDKENQKINSVNKISDIVDFGGNLYFTTETGVIYLLKNNRIKILKNLSPNMTRTFVIDKRGNFWISSTYGILIYNPKKDQIENIKECKDQGKSINFTSAMAICQNTNNAYFGTNSGQLGYVNKETHQTGIIKFTNNPLDAIYDTYIDREGLLYIAANTGLYILNKEHKLVACYYNQPDNPFGLTSSSIKAVYKDDQNNLWVGTWPGVNLAMNGKAFRNYNMYGQTIKLDIKNIQGLTADSKGNLWLGSYHNGINVINLATGEKKLFMPDEKNPFAISSYSVINLFEDSRKTMWLGTYTGYLQRFDPSTNRFISYKFDNIKNGPKAVKDIRSMVEDKEGNLWFISHGFGLLKFNPLTNKYKYFIRDFNNGDHSLADNYAFHLKLTNDSILWISTPSGISRFNIYKETFTNFYHDPSDPNTLSENHVNLSFIDSQNNLWFGTMFGLNFFDQKSGKFYHFYEDDGLPSNHIKSFLEEKPGVIWIATVNGLSRMEYQIKKGKPVVKFRNYNRSDNLQDILFWENSAVKTPKGEMVFGSENGIIAFKPSEITDNKIPPRVYITDLFIYNNKVNIGDYDSLLHHQITFTKEIKLKYTHKIFSFKFVALNYISSDNNKYAYKLEGFDSDWSWVGKKREATYTNLDPGTYRFVVKASNNDGVWNETGASVKVIILPPWWATWWFKMILAALISFGFVYALLLLFKRLNQVANQTILNERNQMKTLINNMPLNIYIKDTDLRYVVVNQNMVSYLGKNSEKEILNKDDKDFYSEELSRQYYQEEQSIMNTGVPVINQEITKTDKNGELSYLSSTKCRIVNQKGETIGLLGVIHNITSQKLAHNEIAKQSEELKKYVQKLSESNLLLEERQHKVEEQSEELKSQSESLKEVNRKLSQSNATKDRFFSIIAHDLRNPFHVVSGFSEILLSSFQRLPEEKINKYLELIHSSSKSGNELLENLLQWSRSQTGQISFNPSHLKLLELIEEIINLLEAGASRKNIELKVDVDPELNVYADDNMLKTILRNIISNAIKFTRQGTISIKAIKITDGCEISVADTGVGISEDIRSKLFLVDEIITTKGTSSENGTGLGLILCKEFVDRHKGKIWVESTEGKGSMFKFILPSA